MAQAARKFELIGEEAAPAPADHDTLTKVNTALLLTALKALSQRAVTALTNLFTIGLVASAWWLWNSVLSQPTPMQLVALGGWAVFCLAIDIVRRRK